MFTKGDPVMHPKFGAGIVKDVKDKIIAGEKQRVYTIKLVGNKGILMVPADRAKESGIYRAADDVDKLILSILDQTPNELGDDNRIRQEAAAKKINSNDPKLVTEALRDLVWYAHHHIKAPQGDSNLRSQAEEKLAGELAITSGIKVDQAKEFLNKNMRRLVLTNSPSET